MSPKKKTQQVRYFNAFHPGHYIGLLVLILFMLNASLWMMKDVIQPDISGTHADDYTCSMICSEEACCGESGDSPTVSNPPCSWNSDTETCDGTIDGCGTIIDSTVCNNSGGLCEWDNGNSTCVDAGTVSNDIDNITITAATPEFPATQIIFIFSSDIPGTVLANAVSCDFFDGCMTFNEGHGITYNDGDGGGSFEATIIITGNNQITVVAMNGDTDHAADATGDTITIASSNFTNSEMNIAGTYSMETDVGIPESSANILSIQAENEMVVITFDQAINATPTEACGEGAPPGCLVYASGHGITYNDSIYGSFTPFVSRGDLLGGTADQIIIMPIYTDDGTNHAATVADTLFDTITIAAENFATGQFTVSGQEFRIGCSGDCSAGGIIPNDCIHNISSYDCLYELNGVETPERTGGLPAGFWDNYMAQDITTFYADDIFNPCGPNNSGVALPTGSPDSACTEGQSPEIDGCTPVVCALHCGGESDICSYLDAGAMGASSCMNMLPFMDGAITTPLYICVPYAMLGGDDGDEDDFKGENNFCYQTYSDDEESCEADVNCTWPYEWDTPECRNIECEDFNFAELCEMDHDDIGIACEWNDTLNSCMQLSCTDLNDMDGITENFCNDYANMRCIWNSGECKFNTCDLYNGSSQNTCESSAYRCVWESDTDTCRDKECGDYDESSCGESDVNSDCQWDGTPCDCKWDYQASECVSRTCSEFNGEENLCTNTSDNLSCKWTWMVNHGECSEAQNCSDLSLCEDTNGLYENHCEYHQGKFSDLLSCIAIEGGGPEVCDNGSDDDGDGATDCADPDCDFFAGCTENCSNESDDDGDGAIDCDDIYCKDKTPCIEICNNGIDDNNNNAIDCGDENCAFKSQYCPASYYCYSNYGEDSFDSFDDGDCNDDRQSCANDVECSTNMDACNADFNCFWRSEDMRCYGNLGPDRVLEYPCNGLADNDGDGLADSEDPDCALFWNAYGGSEFTYFANIGCSVSTCDDGVDNDGDGDVDCDDSDCSTNSSDCGGWFQAGEYCLNLRDDDYDGDFDCDDNACALSPACGSTLAITTLPDGSKIVINGFNAQDFLFDYDSNTLVVGDYNNNQAYVFYNNSGTWSLQTTLTATGAEYFGRSVSVDGDIIAVGSPGNNENEAEDTGAIYVFSRNEGGSDQWGEVAKLATNTTQYYYRLGSRIAIEGDYIAATGYPTTPGAAVHFFYNNAGAWGEVLSLAVENTNGTFGSDIEMNGDRLIIGSSASDSDYGAAYVFYNNSGTWEQEQKITPDTPAYQSWFGRSVSIDGNYIVIGANGGEAAYVFYNNSGTWEQQTILTAPDNAEWDNFGYSVNILESDPDSVIFVGAYQNDSVGAGYLFTGSGSSWEIVNKLKGGASVNTFGFNTFLDSTYLFSAFNNTTSGGGVYAYPLALLFGGGDMPDEICDNGADDDLDGDIDCFDSDCAGDAACPSCTDFSDESTCQSNSDSMSCFWNTSAGCLPAMGCGDLDTETNCASESGAFGGSCEWDAEATPSCHLTDCSAPATGTECLLGGCIWRESTVCGLDCADWPESLCHDGCEWDGDSSQCIVSEDSDNSMPCNSAELGLDETTCEYFSTCTWTGTCDGIIDGGCPAIVNEGYCNNMQMGPGAYPCAWDSGSSSCTANFCENFSTAELCSYAERGCVWDGSCHVGTSCSEYSGEHGCTNEFDDLSCYWSGGSSTCFTANSCADFDSDEENCLSTTGPLGGQCSFSEELNTCVYMHCNNDTQDEDEVGVDCGGSDCMECCTNDVDDDGDGDIDCDDDDCRGRDICQCGNYSCQPAYSENAFTCGQDCCQVIPDEFTCLIFSSCIWNGSSCINSENCTNEIDDDGDGDIDCDDSNCSANVACMIEDCTNHTDDDTDGDIDCEDSDCADNILCDLSCSCTGNANTVRCPTACCSVMRTDQESCATDPNCEWDYADDECTVAYCDSYEDSSTCNSDLNCLWYDQVNPGICRRTNNQNVIVVDDNSDSLFPDPGHCTSDSIPGNCSLRDALHAASSPNTRITFSFTTPTTINLLGPLYLSDSYSDVMISGPLNGSGEPLVNITSGDGVVFEVGPYGSPTGIVTIQNLALYSDNEAIFNFIRGAEKLTLRNNYIGLESNLTRHGQHHAFVLSISSGWENNNLVMEDNVIYGYGNTLFINVEDDNTQAFNQLTLSNNYFNVDKSENWLGTQDYGDVSRIHVPLSRLINISGNIIAGYMNFVFDNDAEVDSLIIENNHIGTNSSKTPFFSSAYSNPSIIFEPNASSSSYEMGDGDIFRISGNTLMKGIKLVSVHGYSDDYPILIQGNYIGNDGEDSLMEDVYYSDRLIDIQKSEYILIGGSEVENRNFIGGSSTGIIINNFGFLEAGDWSNDITIQNNYIGVTDNGESAIGNQREGIEIHYPQSKNITIKDNVISGHQSYGVFITVNGNQEDNITSESGNNIVIQNNKIGTNALGNSVIPNNQGVSIVLACRNDDCEVHNSSHRGQRAVISGNVLSGNYMEGLSISYRPESFDHSSNLGAIVAGLPIPSPHDTIIVDGNYIGTNPNGDQLGNGFNGTAVLLPNGLTFTNNYVKYNGSLSSFLEEENLPEEFEYIYGLFESFGGGMLLFGATGNSTTNVITDNHFSNNEGTGFQIIPFIWNVGPYSTNFDFARNTVNNNKYYGLLTIRHEAINLNTCTFSGNAQGTIGSGDSWLTAYSNIYIPGYQVIEFTSGAIEILDALGNTIQEGVNNITLTSDTGFSMNYRNTNPLTPSDLQLQFSPALGHSKNALGQSDAGTCSGNYIDSCDDLGSYYACDLFFCDWDIETDTCSSAGEDFSFMFNSEIDNQVRCTIDFGSNIMLPKYICGQTVASEDPETHIVNGCGYTPPFRMAGVWGYPNQFNQILSTMYGDESPFAFELYSTWPLIPSSGINADGELVDLSDYTINVTMSDGRTGEGTYAWNNLTTNNEGIDKRTLEQGGLIPAYNESFSKLAYQVAQVTVENKTGGGNTPITYTCPDPTAIDLDPEFSLSLMDGEVKVDWGEITLPDLSINTWIQFFDNYYLGSHKSKTIERVRDGKTAEVRVIDKYAYDIFNKLIHNSDPTIRENAKKALLDAIDDYPNARRSILNDNGIKNDAYDYWPFILKNLLTNNDTVANFVFKLSTEFFSYHKKVKLSEGVEIERHVTMNRIEKTEDGIEPFITNIEIDPRDDNQIKSVKVDEGAVKNYFLDSPYSSQVTGTLACSAAALSIYHNRINEDGHNNVSIFNEDDLLKDVDPEYMTQLKEALLKLGKDYYLLDIMMTFAKTDTLSDSGALGGRLIINHILENENVANLLSLLKNKNFETLKSNFFGLPAIKKIQNCVGTMFHSGLWALQNEITDEVVYNHVMNVKDTDKNAGVLLFAAIQDSRVRDYWDKEAQVDFIQALAGETGQAALDPDFADYVEENRTSEGRRVEILDEISVTLTRTNEEGNVEIIRSPSANSYRACDGDPNTCAIDYSITPDPNETTTYTYQIITSNDSKCDNYSEIKGEIASIDVPPLIKEGTKIDAYLDVSVLISDERDKALLTHLIRQVEKMVDAEELNNSCLVDYESSNEIIKDFYRVEQKNNRQNAIDDYNQLRETFIKTPNINEDIELDNLIRAAIDKIVLGLRPDIYSDCAFQSIYDNNKEAWIADFKEKIQGNNNPKKRPLKTWNEVDEFLTAESDTLKSYIENEYNKFNTVKDELKNIDFKTMGISGVNNFSELLSHLNGLTSTKDLSYSAKQQLLSIADTDVIEGHRKKLVFSIWAKDKDSKRASSPIAEVNFEPNVFGEAEIIILNKDVPEMVAGIYDFTIKDFQPSGKSYVVQKAIIDHSLMRGVPTERKDVYKVEEGADFYFDERSLTFGDVQDDEKITLDDLQEAVSKFRLNQLNMKEAFDTDGNLKIKQFNYILERLQEADDPTVLEDSPNIRIRGLLKY